MILRPTWFQIAIGLILSSNASAEQSPLVHHRPIVIAHRGASGYLPEHTLAAKALAFGQGADYVEQDVVLTRDDIPIVLHDVHLDSVTDVARRFPDRARDDGRFYAIDFTLAEIQSLRVNERIDVKTGKAIFPGRFPVNKTTFIVPTLGEEIEFVQGLNRSTGKQVGIYPEIKKPGWHRRQGKDISRIILEVLAEHGYVNRSDAVFLQCFDPVEVRRLRFELGTKLRLVQLLGDDAEYDELKTAEGLARLAEYVDVIGPSISQIVTIDSNGRAQLSSLTKDARQHDLEVHAYTVRADALPKGVNSFQTLHELLFRRARVDGIFTDFVDQSIRSRELLFKDGSKESTGKQNARDH